MNYIDYLTKLKKEVYKINKIFGIIKEDLKCRVL